MQLIPHCNNLTICKCIDVNIQNAVDCFAKCYQKLGFNSQVLTSVISDVVYEEGNVIFLILSGDTLSQKIQMW